MARSSCLRTFKKYFAVIDQKARQKGTSAVEHDFYKLLNNSNFGIDRRNNIGDCLIEPFYDEVGEIPTLKNLVQFSETISLEIFFLHV